MSPEEEGLGVQTLSEWYVVESIVGKRKNEATKGKLVNPVLQNWFHCYLVLQKSTISSGGMATATVLMSGYNMTTSITQRN